MTGRPAALKARASQNSHIVSPERAVKHRCWHARSRKIGASAQCRGPTSVDIRGTVLKILRILQNRLTGAAVSSSLSAETSMRRPSLRKPLLALFVIGVSVLALPRTSNAQSKPRSDRYHITREEIAESGGNIGTAYDVVRLLRTRWLNPPLGRNSSNNADGTSGGATEIILYINDIRQQSLEDLKTVKASRVADMRFLEQNRAIQLRGPGHELGAIEVITTDRPK